MKLALTLILSCTISMLNGQNPSNYAININKSDIKKMLYEYSSDEFMGREVGSYKQRLAVNFLKEKYLEMGVSSVNEDGNYFQYVPLINENFRTVEFKIAGEDYYYYKDFITKTPIKSKKIDLDSYAYVGYGIKDKNYNDYKNIDVKDKLVVAVAGEPMDKFGNYFLTKSKTSSIWSNSEESHDAKINLAYEMGAAGFILIDDYYFKRYSYYYKKNELKGETNV